MTATARTIQYLSSPAPVSMSDDYYGLAGLNHFWIRRRFEVMCHLAGDAIRQSSAVAEVGCGHGVLQRQIEDHFHQQVTGFDLNEYALKSTLSRTSPVCCYNLMERQREYAQRFDLILLCDVLEHLSDEDEFVQAIRFHLKPQGRLLINVPALDALWSKYDVVAGHFRRYTISTLRQVARRNGMTLRVWSYWGLPLTPLLLLRKVWLAGRSDETAYSAGFDSRGPVVNGVLLSLSRCELIPQRWLGSSLMAVLE